MSSNSKINSLRIKQIKGALKIRLINNAYHKSAIFLLALFSLSFIVVPLVIILTLKIEITFWTIISLFLGFLCSRYFFKLLLWNKYGEEIFIIEEHKFKVSYNYKIIKENRPTIPFKIIQLFFYEDGVMIEADSTKMKKYKDKCSIIVFAVDETYISSIKEVPVIEIIKLSHRIKRDYSYIGT